MRIVMMAKVDMLFLYSLLMIQASMQQPAVSCPGIHEECKCTDENRGGYKVECMGNYWQEAHSVSLTSGRVLQVKCTFKTTAKQLEMLLDQSMESASWVKILVCPLPKKSFVSTNNSVTSLIFKSNTPLRDSLRWHHLAGLESVTYLVLANNEISDINEDLFKDMHALEYLDLSQNFLTSLPGSIFNNTYNIQEINLSDNKITQFEIDTFSNTPFLQRLNLRRNRVTAFDPILFNNLPNLTYLNLHSNKLTTLDINVFSKLINMRDLDIGDNKIVELRNEHFRALIKLVKLRIDDNETLKLASQVFSYLTNIRDLSIQMCKLTTLPYNMMLNAVNVERVLLNDNLIKTLQSDTFKSNRFALEVDLSKNKLETLPEDVFSELKLLHSLFLNDNKLQQIPKQLLMSLRQLEKLDMSNNELIKIHPEAFLSLTKLRVARFSNNKLTILADGNKRSYRPISPFRWCHSLQELYFDNNRITTVFTDWRKSMPSLSYLGLRNNSIEEITTEDFQFNSHHLTFDLRNNLIKEIDLQSAEMIMSSHLQDQSRSLSVLLADNPLNCDSCVNFPLVMHHYKRLLPRQVSHFLQLDVDGLRCVKGSNADPRSSFNGRALTSLTLNDFSKCSSEVCPSSCTCKFDLNNATAYIKCCEVPDALPLVQGMNYTDLSFENCDLDVMRDISSNVGYGHVTILHLGNNSLSEVNSEQLPPLLNEIELHGNNLSTIPDAILIRQLTECQLSRITLAGNPFQCSCELQIRVKLIQAVCNNVIEDLDKVTCLLDGINTTVLMKAKLCANLI